MKKSAILIFFLCLLPFGCQKKEGPAERLGKNIDKSVDDVGSKFREAFSDTKEKMGKATDDLKKSVDSFGNRIKKDTGSRGPDPEDSDRKRSDSEDN